MPMACEEASVWMACRVPTSVATPKSAGLNGQHCHHDLTCHQSQGLLHHYTLLIGASPQRVVTIQERCYTGMRSPVQPASRTRPQYQPGS